VRGGSLDLAGEGRAARNAAARSATDWKRAKTSFAMQRGAPRRCASGTSGRQPPRAAVEGSARKFRASDRCVVLDVYGGCPVKSRNIVAAHRPMSVRASTRDSIADSRRHEVGVPRSIELGP